MQIEWTHPAVLALSPSGDPRDAVIEKAQSTVLKALQAGWKGPPFDPFDLAQILGIRVVPRQKLRDARALRRRGRTIIEYNPTRPDGRVRFSIAHEIAHTFFPDDPALVRYRGASAAQRDDDWQLELLCNLAASELLMPAGSFEETAPHSASISILTELAKDYRVSLEALLRRVPTGADEPVAFFSASRSEPSAPKSRYRIEYVQFSRSWLPPPNPISPPEHTVLANCLAIGTTASGTELWTGLAEEVQVECVGAPPYPGHSSPRVLGLLKPFIAAAVSAPRITEHFGDATNPHSNGHRLIVHLVNDKTPNWGGPFARALKKRYPRAQRDFKEWVTQDNDNLSLGNVRFFSVSEDLSIATMIAQRGYGPSKSPRLRYDALRQCFSTVQTEAKRLGASVHMPRVGSGAAGGIWSVISALIDRAFCWAGTSVTIYVLPGKRLRATTEAGQLGLSLFPR